MMLSNKIRRVNRIWIKPPTSTSFFRPLLLNLAARGDHRVEFRDFFSKDKVALFISLHGPLPQLNLGGDAGSARIPCR